MAQPQLWNPWKEAWDRALAFGSSTGISVLWLGLCGLLLAFVFTIGAEWLVRGRNMKALTASLQSWTSWLGTVLAFVVVWGCLFVYAFIKTVYGDHGALVQQRDSVSDERDQCKKKFEESTINRPAQPSKSNAPAKIERHGEAPGAGEWGITQGAGSIAQVGGQGNTAIIEAQGNWLLTKDEQTALQNEVARHAGRVEFSYLAFDPESLNYAEKLAYAFHEAGWTLVDQTPNYVGSTCTPNEHWDCRGANIAVHNRSSDLAKSVISALGATVRHLNVTDSDNPDETLIHIFVAKYSR